MDKVYLTTMVENCLKEQSEPQPKSSAQAGGVSELVQCLLSCRQMWVQFSVLEKLGM